MAWDTAMAFECHIRFPGLGGLGAKLIEAHLPHTVADALSRTRELENFKNCFDVDLDGKLETLETEAIGNLLATLYHSLAAVWTSLCISMLHRLALHHALELSATYIRLAQLHCMSAYTTFFSKSYCKCPGTKATHAHSVSAARLGLRLRFMSYTITCKYNVIAMCV